MKRQTKRHSAARYPVILHRTKTGYSASVPDLPGCIAAAKSLTGTSKLIAEAIGLHLELLRESGEKIPKPSRSFEFKADEFSNDEFCTWVEARLPEAVSG
jgi:predicted RNase H-like HicB family nuclease